MPDTAISPALIGRLASAPIAAFWTAGARINYFISDKTSIDNALGFTYVDYERFFDTLDIVNQLYIDWMVTGKTSLGLGLGLGYAESEGGPGQFYEQLNARVRYAATSKFILTASGGVEFRQIEGGENQVAPIFGVGATYLPFDSMSLNLDAYRRIRPSQIFNDANYSATGVVLGRPPAFPPPLLFRRVAGGYEATEYDSIDDESDFNRDRDDHYFFVRPSLEFRVGERRHCRALLRASKQQFRFRRLRICKQSSRGEGGRLLLGPCSVVVSPRSSTSSPSRSPLRSGSDASAGADADAPVPVAKAAPVIDSNHILSAQDIVEISVFQEEELGVKSRISEDGTIQMPLIGTVRIAGRSVREAQAIIEQALKKDYLVAPQVSVSIADFARRRFAVLGQVQKPGTYEMPGNETLDLLQAIGLAGGYTRSANPSKIIVKRVVSGSEKIFRLNGKDMARGGTERFRVQAGDTITVEESFF